MCGILIESRRFHREETKEKEQEGGEREKKKERKKEKESEEALIKPAARRVIKTHARPRERDGSSGAYRHAGDFPSLRSPRDRNMVKLAATRPISIRGKIANASKGA